VETTGKVAVDGNFHILPAQGSERNPFIQESLSYFPSQFPLGICGEASDEILVNCNFFNTAIEISERLTFV
jgi:hypothetical protein